MHADEVAAYVRGRIGLEIQAVGPVRTRMRGHDAPRVWTVMTEPGYFWFVEDGAAFEVFRALPYRSAPASQTACYSAGDAARLFRSLHPASPPAAVPHPSSPDTPDERHAGAAYPDAAPPAAIQARATATVPRSFFCEACGASVTRRRPIGQDARALCPRCRHAERERLRYQHDPEYRERRLAYSAARYRHAQEQHAS